MNTDENERVAKLEVKVEMLLDLKDKMEENNDLLMELRNELTRYKGIAGGIMLALSCIWAFIIKLILPLWSTTGK